MTETYIPVQPTDLLPQREALTGAEELIVETPEGVQRTTYGRLRDDATQHAEEIAEDAGAAAGQTAGQAAGAAAGSAAAEPFAQAASSAAAQAAQRAIEAAQAALAAAGAFEGADQARLAAQLARQLAEEAKGLAEASAAQAAVFAAPKFVDLATTEPPRERKNEALFSEQISGSAWERTRMDAVDNAAVSQGAALSLLRPTTTSSTHFVRLFFPVVAGRRQVLCFDCGACGYPALRLHFQGTLFPSNQSTVGIDVETGVRYSGTSGWDVRIDPVEGAPGIFRVRIIGTPVETGVVSVQININDTLNSGGSSFPGDGVSGILFGRVHAYSGDFDYAYVRTEAAPVHDMLAPETIDGMEPGAGALVLVKDATDPILNGIYLYEGADQPMPRPPVWDEAAELHGVQFVVQRGATLADTSWLCAVHGEVGVDPISFAATTIPGADLSLGTASETDGGTRRTLREILVERGWNIRAFGADPTGQRSVARALQTAIHAAYLAGGGDVCLPPGTYRWFAGTDPIVSVPSGVNLVGAGRARTIIVMDFSGPNPSAGGNRFIDISADANVEVTGITFVGGGPQMPAKFPVVGQGITGRVRVAYCGFIHATGQCVSFSGGGNSRSEVLYEANFIWEGNAGGLAGRSLNYFLAHRNFIFRCNDDAIFCHTQDGTPTPVDMHAVITDNIIVESQGIAALGAKKTVVANNVIDRAMAFGLKIRQGRNFLEGYTAGFGLIVANNVVTDVFLRPETPPRNQEQYYMLIDMGVRQPGTLAAPPGMVDPNTGSIIDPLGSGAGHYYTNAVGYPLGVSLTPEEIAERLSRPGVGGGHAIITGNVLLRTRPAVSAYAEWGGSDSLFVGRNGAPEDGGYYRGPITEDHLAVPGLTLDATSYRDIRITNNLIRTSGDFAIYFRARPDRAEQAGNKGWMQDLGLDGVTIEGNHLAWFRASAVGWPTSYLTDQRVAFIGNDVDGDPFFRHPSRNADGSWAAEDACVGIQAATVRGMVAKYNRFRNVSRAITQSPIIALGANDLECEPASFGFSAANKGIGFVPRPGKGWRIRPRRSDPTSPGTYLQWMEGMEDEAEAMPASGFYVPGHRVLNTAAEETLADDRVVSGWLRRTWGTSHAAGIDWAPIYADVA